VNENEREELKSIGQRDCMFFWKGGKERNLRILINNVGLTILF